MTILITGSRYWKDGRRIVERLLQEPAGTVLIEGGADGVDKLARYAGLALGFKVMTVRADWQVYGKAAGPVRNRKMLDMRPDKVLAFHDAVSQSRGTLDCVNEAIRRNIPVELINGN